MKLGLLVIAHEFTPSLEYVSNLCNRLDVKVILHIDAKTDINTFPSSFLNKVILTDNRVKTEWGKFSQVQTMLELIHKGCEIELDVMQFISGDSLPVRSMEDIYNFYLKHPDKSFMTISTLPKSQERRLKYIHTEKRPISIFDKIIAKLRNKFNIYKKNPRFDCILTGGIFWGSNWFGLSKKAAKYILDYVDANPEYVRAFEQGLCIDEIFFHTIIANSPLIDSNFNAPVMWVNFRDKNPSPDTIFTKDIPFVQDTLKESSMFARKISKDMDLAKWSDTFLEND